jgi:hypothetical protein
VKQQVEEESEEEKVERKIKGGGSVNKIRKEKLK